MKPLKRRKHKTEKLSELNVLKKLMKVQLKISCGGEFINSGAWTNTDIYRRGRK